MIKDYTDELDAIGHNIGQKSPEVIKDAVNQIINDVLDNCIIIR